MANSAISSTCSKHSRIAFIIIATVQLQGAVKGKGRAWGKGEVGEVGPSDLCWGRVWEGDEPACTAHKVPDIINTSSSHGGVSGSVSEADCTVHYR